MCVSNIYIYIYIYTYTRTYIDCIGVYIGCIVYSYNVVPIIFLNNNYYFK